jgi:hypothetical protein
MSEAEAPVCRPVERGAPPFRKVKDRYIREPFPAWTAIDIDRLVPDNGLVEIKLVARRRPSQ